MAQNQKQHLSRKQIWFIAAAAGIVLAAVGVFILFSNRPTAGPGPGGQVIPVEGGASTTNGGVSEMSGEPFSVSIRLSEGKPRPQAFVPVPQVTGETLSEEEVQAVLGRLPPLEPGEGDQQDFRPSGDPIPPPRTGETIQEAFPPPQDAPQPPPADTGPLQVLRYTPEGEIFVAPFINVTFNQPMVPLTALEDLAAQDVPVQIDPALPGKWRWLGTRTLNFQYESALIDRLPKATIYRVTVPAGTRSATGGELAETVEWSFQTPPPKMVVGYPADIPQPLDPLFFIAFDQRIDPPAVLETIKVDAGGQNVRLELAGEAAVQEDETVSRLVKDAGEGRWLAFRAASPLPQDTPIRVVIGPGTPSAEGPLATQDAQSYGFHTYAPLRIIEHGCAWGDNPCRPLTPFFIRFNNPIDPDLYRDEMLRISPELPGAVVDLFGDTIQIRGATRGQTTYTVVVSGEIADTFGQTLGADATLTFRVGPAEARLAGPESIFVTLDPALDKPVFSIYAINYTRLDLEVYAVQPSDWPAFKQYLREFRYENKNPQVPGQRVIDRTLRLEAPSDALAEVDIDLSEAMDGAPSLRSTGKSGQFVVIAAPPREVFKNSDERRWQTVIAWVQVTGIGLDAFVDHSQMVAWATDLKTGAPLSEASLRAGDLETMTGEDGVSRFDLPSGVTYLVARKGSDLAMLPASTYEWGDEAWSPRSVSDELRWFIFDDRAMYQPGEEMHVKGWLRRIGGKQDGDVTLLGSDLSAIRYQAIDPQGNELGSGRVETGPLGGFDFVFTIPENTNLGYAQLILDAEGSLGNLNGLQAYHQFQIQEFRRPEYEVIARNESPAPYFAGEPATVAVEAKYYAGGPLPDAEVNWNVSYTPGHYAPPNWPEFVFGTWQPWWWFYEPVAYEMESGFRGGFPGGETTYQTFNGRTGADGTHYLQLDFDSDRPEPISVQADATVMDVNRQAWTGTTSLLVHPASLYVGLRSDQYFVERGTPIRVDAIVTDLDGNPVSDRPVDVRAARLEWKYLKGDWQEVEADVQTCSTGSTNEPVTCTFQTSIGGSYRITAEVRDDQGRLNRTQITRWVSGGEQPPSRKVEKETVNLIPDRETYQPGDVARVLVQSPFTPAEGLLTVSRSGILYTRSFHITDGTITLEIPIEEAHLPNLNIQVDLVGAAKRVDNLGEPVAGAPPRPAYASGQLNLSIPPLQRTLSLEVNPEQSELEPGAETAVNVRVIDALGQPVADAEIAVVVVDEANLALSNYQLADPLGIFYTQRLADVGSYYGRASIILSDPQALANAANDTKVMTEMQAGAAADMAAGAPAPAMEAPAAQPTQTASLARQGIRQDTDAEPIRVRTDFNPLAAFVPAARTDGEGMARVAFKLPDSLTRYRVMVVAVMGGSQFGSGEANLTARLPLMARPSAPRFLNFGDRFELPVVLQNQTDDALLVDVVLQVTNLELIDDGAQPLVDSEGQPLPGAGRRITVPPRDRLEVRFPVRTLMAGVARFQVAAVSGSFADAATIELPVYTPATTEAFAVYGVVDDGAVFQPVAAPHGVFPQYGGLEVQTSSTALQALTDAVLYLTSYPYECSEQLASRILAISALRDVLSAFKADGLPSPDEMEASVTRDLERLQGMQNADGGFPYWQRGKDSIPFNTIHVAHALQRAKQMDFAVPGEMEQNALTYLREIESHYPDWYSPTTRRTLSAYALVVRRLVGDGEPAKARKILDEVGTQNLASLPMEAIGWLWQAMLDDPASSAHLEAIRQHVNNRVVETAGAANFTTEYTDQTYLLLSSDRRTDAILLEALILDQPESDLTPKLVSGLLAHRTRGRWENTQENVFVLLALDRYFDTYESVEPDFVARLWLGENYAGSHEFRGYSTERSETQIPMTYLLDETLGGGGTQDLIVSKEGPGRLYYRLGLRYAPSDLELDPLDMGFVVGRVYEAVDNPEDVSRDENGAWHIKAGARVRVRLNLVADNRRYHVALVDHLPAGLEIVNPALAVSGSLPQDPASREARYGWWWWSWFEYQNLRDDRAEAFTSLLWEGVYEYTYIARATTPGTFIVPPAKAEEMYSPEVFGHSASEVVIVE